MYVIGINFASFYDFSIGFWNFSDSVVYSYFVEFSVFFIFPGMMHNWSGFISDVICCRFKLGKYQQKDSTASSSHKGGISNAKLPYDTFSK
jgi:hypothetical protein